MTNLSEFITMGTMLVIFWATCLTTLLQPNGSAPQSAGARSDPQQ